MSSGATAVGTNPFSPRAVLAIVGLGAILFVALLWLIGAGMTSGRSNDGGTHAASYGLTGFAAMARFIGESDHEVRETRSKAAFDEASLLVLTPPSNADAEEIGKIIGQHRYDGPTLLVLPKWMAFPVNSTVQVAQPEVKDGWVQLVGADPPSWGDDIGVIGALDLRIAQGKEGDPKPRWSGMAMSGTLPDPRAVQTMSSGRIIPLVLDGRGQVLAGYLDDGGYYPELARAAGTQASDEDNDYYYPVVIVAEPDLLNNYGYSLENNARLSHALVDAAMLDESFPVYFDLTLSGHGRSANLLTLAFTPPFLAATLCLLMAALAVGWRAFLRFGPPRRGVRAIAFGKRALVANAAGLVRRTGRLHLIGGPYVNRTRERIVRALALPRTLDGDHADAAIDRALESRQPDATPFSQIAARLRAARNAHDLLKAARELRAVERTLIT